jgi:phenylalanine-4-hydroxylase
MKTTMTVPESFSTVQRWNAYTREQHDVWSLLYRRRMQSLRRTASRLFLRGMETIGLRPDLVPDLNDVNARLEPLTGWNAVPVSGFLPARQFFESLAGRRFPTTVTVRPREQLDYLPEPDIFHDVFGHVPLHADPVFAGYLQRFGQIAAASETESQVTRMARLFWFTVEFGLIREEGEVRIYGSGLISSQADAANALSSSCQRRPFSLDAVFEQPYEIDRVQDVLFVIESFEELFEALR